MRGALVTGAGQRLGRAMVKALAADGWHVAIHYNHSRQEAEETADAIARNKGHAAAVQADLTDPGATQRLIGDARAAIGGDLHCLINNASLFEFDTAAGFTVEKWDRHHAINQRAPALLARDFAAALPPPPLHETRSKTKDEMSGEPGVIINLLDQKLANLNPDFFSYTAAKIGLQGLTVMQAMAYAPRIRVCGIAPGLTLPPPGMDNERFQAAHHKTPLGRGSAVGDIVEAMRFIITSPAITGEIITVDGGQHLQPRPHDVMFDPPPDDAP